MKDNRTAQLYKELKKLLKKYDVSNLDFRDYTRSYLDQTEISIVFTLFNNEKKKV